MNERFQNAVNGVRQATPPIWFMRQAGRYHRHYQNLRKAHSFMDLCKQPKLAAEVALGPVEDFDFDVAILFSDLLFPLEALGMGLSYDPSPKLGWHLTPENLHSLRPVDDAILDLCFQREALVETRRVLPSNKSLIGFVGGPWTLFVYAMEGGHQGLLLKSKEQLELFQAFCEILVPFLEKNIALQIDGGAEVVMIFDTAAGELSPGIFKRLVQPHLLKLAENFPGRVGYYSKLTQAVHLEELKSSKLFAGFGVDHRWDMATELMHHTHGFLQGNFDQALLRARPKDFERQLTEYLEPISKLSREERRFWVCGLGHGVLPETPEENVRTFVKTIREVLAT